MSQQMVKLTVDGIEVEVPKGTNLIEASKQAGVEVPHFCYHSHLSIAGNCRMCMVEVEGMRGPQIGCNTGANEGMVVKTDTDLIKEQRAAVMEFLLVNHPIDCPVCDQAGECKLQMYYMEHDRRDSVVDLDDKLNKGKAIEVGPRVMLDQERCVACARCVRFCDEITETGELRLLNRGDHTTIGTFPGRALDNDYSVNTVDICPVGALTSRDFRFQARVWYLRHDDSICPGCATGCNVKISHYEQTTLQDYNGMAYRLRPRVNDEVNEAWMCDFGRREYCQVNEARIQQPFGHGIEIGWDGALGHVKNALLPVKDRGADAIAGVISYDATTEEVWLFRKLLREVFGQDRIAVVARRADGKADDYLIDGDKHPNRAGALLAAGEAAVGDLAGYLEGKVAVLVLGADLTDQLHGEAVKSAFAAINHKIVMAANRSETSDHATILMPTVSYAEKDGTFVNRQGRVQRLFPVLRKGFSCRRDLDVITDVANTFDAHWPRPEAAAIFAEMAAELPALAGLDYGTIGKLGAPLRDAALSTQGRKA
ncbi:MAG: (2Fe-2S)-binding protein [Planctomycetes bacterium]|nr:(2Fe-2S)-binding protein [Planctomycetota bacterium]